MVSFRVPCLHMVRFKLASVTKKPREFNKNYLTLSFTPYQTFIFLEILFKIRNQQIDKEFYFLSKPLKILFRTPKLQTLTKPVGNIFDRRDPQKNPLN